MTDTEKELVKVLTDATFYGTGFMKDGKHIPLEDVYLDPRDALIKAQAAEIERLREALKMILDIDEQDGVNGYFLAQHYANAALGDGK